VIAVHRGDEPEALVAIRRRKLAEASLALAAGSGTRPSLDGYQVARHSLHTAQHGKCAYCERDAGVASSPVEHFRPKAGAWRIVAGEPFVDAERYWWLTWTWENLFFACVSCNGASRKGNWFPLVDGEPLSLPSVDELREGSGPAFDLGAERSLFLDPSRDVPSEHMRWVPLDRRRRWDHFRWVLEGTTDRGRVTIERLGLGDVEDRVNVHVRNCLLPLVRDAQDGHWSTIKQAQLDALISPCAIYPGATWSVLHFLHARLELAQRGVALRPAS
jgi:hypothetical protein